jgi:hypothetical protein
MPKVVAMAHAQQPEQFDPLLPIELPLPFPGKWAQVTIGYNVGAALSLGGHEAALMTDLDAQERAAARRWGEIQGQIEDRFTADKARSATLQTAAEQYALIADRNDALEPLYTEQAAITEQRRLIARARHLRVIAEVVRYITWPYAGDPPDPQDPDSFSAWPDLVLEWIGGIKGAQEVRKRLDDPLSWNGSATT